MTQSQTVTVDQQEILNRANEVEAPMADPPTDVPITPCELTAAKNAAQQLVLSADNMREYLAAGAKERQRLATSLRNAAKAYGEVDKEARNGRPRRIARALCGWVEHFQPDAARRRQAVPGV